MVIWPWTNYAYVYGAGWCWLGISANIWPV